MKSMKKNSPPKPDSKDSLPKHSPELRKILKKRLLLKELLANMRLPDKELH
jgi:hypothetical protein